VTATTVDINTLRQRLLALFVAETQQIREFTSILEEEQRVLLGQDVQPLFALAGQKTRYVRQLQQLADSRAAILAQAGMPRSREGIENLLGATDNQIWNSYLAAATRAHDLNQANGQHITARLAHNHQALAILMAHSDQPTVYGPDGASRTRPGSRLLGSY
jgi:flagellar biosynthesis/type III secretory pathway chaperone